MPLTPEQYIRHGPSSAWHIPDLVPTDPSKIRLLFVLESPHVNEPDSRTPIVGGAGKSALRFLQGTSWTGDSLGGYIAGQHDLGNEELAVMNVSTVPLQQEAFLRTAVAPDMTPQEWRWLGVTWRNSRAKTVDATGFRQADTIGRLLLDRLQDRIDQLALARSCTVVACGRFAQRYVLQLSGLPGRPLKVPHPANNQWHSKSEPVPKDLVQVRELFAAHTK